MNPLKFDEELGAYVKHVSRLIAFNVLEHAVDPGMVIRMEVKGMLLDLGNPPAGMVETWARKRVGLKALEIEMRVVL